MVVVDFPSPKGVGVILRQSHKIKNENLYNAIMLPADNDVFSFRTIGEALKYFDVDFRLSCAVRINFTWNEPYFTG